MQPAADPDAWTDGDAFSHTHLYRFTYGNHHGDPSAQRYADSDAHAQCDQHADGYPYTERNAVCLEYPS